MVASEYTRNCIKMSMVKTVLAWLIATTGSLYRILRIGGFGEEIYLAIDIP